MDSEIKVKIDSTIEAICKGMEEHIGKEMCTEDISAMAQMISALADLIRARADMRAENYLPSSKSHIAE